MLVYLSTGALAIASVAAASRVAPPCGLSSRMWANVLWVVAFLALFLPSALRFDVGTDYSSKQFYLGYVEVFRVYADGGSLRFGIDAGYLALIRLIVALGGNVQWFFAITSALVCGLTLRACRRLSCSPTLSVAIFLVAGLYLESFNIVRQWIAVACVLNAFGWVGWSDEDGDARPRVGRRSFVRYAVWVCLGAVAHSSALFWLLLWPLFAVPLNGRRAAALVVALVLAAFFGWRLLAVVLEGTKYGRYFHDPSGLYNTPHLRPNAIVTTGVTLALTIWAYRGCLRAARPGQAGATGGEHALARLLSGDSYGRWASALTMCQVLLLALLVSEAFLPYIVDRVARFLMPLLVLQLPYALAEVRRRGLSVGPLAGERLRRALALAACACWLATSCIQFVGGKDDVLPYRSILTTPRDEVARMFDTPPEIPEADRPVTE
ncbi:EpsG family protein [uncultured Parolsenella sp.]|uniref:EpsG family protein n=1 Tax=uncultured Parolsenella sp. TaxID=2083008 RepID=UPI0027DCE62A|nr:EpsG family protein [uncultured Parolsenella sp.]